MRRRSLLALSFAASVAAFGRAQEPGRDLPSRGHTPAREPLSLPPKDQERVHQVAEQLVCYCGCARQTVADCDCGVADEVRRSIWSDLQSGKSPSQIVEAYVGGHGAEFRSMPVARGLGLVAWALPWTAIVVATGVVALMIRRWSRRPPPTAPPAASSEEATKDSYQQMVEKELSDRGLS